MSKKQIVIVWDSPLSGTIEFGRMSADSTEEEKQFALNFAKKVALRDAGEEAANTVRFREGV